MTLTEIRELRDKLEPLSAPGGIQVKFLFKTDVLQLDASPRTEQHLGKMQEVLEPYRKRFGRIGLAIRPDPNFCREVLERMDFFHLKRVLVSALRAEIDALTQRPNSETFYAFVVPISPEHHGMSVSWNTAGNWATREAGYAARGQPARPGTKYNTPDFHCESLTELQSVWKSVREILAAHEHVCREYFKLAGRNGIFHALYENRFRATAIHALKEVAPELDRLPTTADFVYYVEDYAGGGDELLLKIETIPEMRLREMMPWLFPGNDEESSKKA